MEEIQTLKNKRAAYKGILTKVKNFIKDNEINRDNMDTFTAKLNNLNAACTKFEDIHYKLLNFITTKDEDYNDSIVQWDTFEEEYYEVSTKLENLIADFRAGIESDKLNDTDDLESINKQPFVRGVDIKLPRVQITKFNGNLESWLNFSKTYEALIHNNGNISDLVKFHQLIGCLEGEAADLIADIDIEGGNYEFAWQTIEKHYKNNKILVDTHMGNLFNANKLEFSSAKGLSELFNLFKKNINALKRLGVEVEGGDPFIVYLITSKLDKDTLKAWDTSRTVQTKEYPTYEEIKRFLDVRCDSLLTFERRQIDVGTSRNNNYNRGVRGNIMNENRTKFRSLLTTTNESNCLICDKGNHQLFKCDTFLRSNIDKRREFVERSKACWNCLRLGHRASDCKGRVCYKCQKHHNSLLCSENNKQANLVKPSFDKASNTIVEPRKSYYTHMKYESKKENIDNDNVILATACVRIITENGKETVGRFILDNGSEINFISKELVNELNVITRKGSTRVQGIGNISTNVNEEVSLVIQSRTSEFYRKVNFKILTNIIDGTKYAGNIDLSKWVIPDYIVNNLADPEFGKSGKKIDGLLGVKIFFEILKMERYFLFKSDNQQEKGPYFLNTDVGWIYSGALPNKINNGDICLLSCDVSKQNQRNLKNCKRAIIEEQQACENLFQSSIKICEVDRKFVVALPFKEGMVGNTFERARDRFLNLERRLGKDLELKGRYTEFIKEYESMGHLEVVPAEEVNNVPHYYLPHHAIIKDSTTTSLRVVFDASFKSSNGLSLNNILYTGEALQNDIFNIIVSFRLPKYGLTADIAKMYRQIWVCKEHVDFQRILWRTDPEQPLQHYRLRTVTYGTSAAPYLAIRCLRQIAKDIQISEPGVSRIIKDCFYMDDLIVGANDINELQDIQNKVELVLRERGFQLRKWCTNCSQLMEDLKASSDITNQYAVNLDDGTVKTLGIIWKPEKDEFGINVHKWRSNQIVTKRVILADIQSLWDPIGLLAPVIILGKMFMQELWREAKFKDKLNSKSRGWDWDETISMDLQQKWLKFRDSLQIISLMGIPRRAIVGKILALHGFSDASEKAYGCCIYAVSQVDGIREARLLCAKAKVSPLDIGSIDRLELLAAHLLSKLMSKTLKAMNVTVPEVHYWSDSEICLAWVSGYPREWSTFVANRIAQIQEVSNYDDWHYVDTKENPADIASRGIKAFKIKDCELWWKGPPWLTDWENWPIWKNTLKKVPERRKLTYSLIVSTTGMELINKFSKWSKLVRVVCYLFRFVNNLRSSKENRNLGWLTAVEFNMAIEFLIKGEQAANYGNEIAHLEKGLEVPKSSKLLGLNVFLDKEGMLRVGGRLHNAQISEGKKHPIVLPYGSKVTQLIMEDYHLKYLHIGPQGLLAVTRNRYWPINGRNAAKAIVHACVICKKAKPLPLKQIMASLPKERVNPGRPFEVTGVDFCGPFSLKLGLRKSVVQKAYISVFVCLSTKSIHLELVTALSTDGFMAALRRFFSRRGVSRRIYSDNGTNFVGANKELKRLVKNSSIQEAMASQQVEWHFIPPGAPHFGGIWESAVKSVKYHLKRIVKDTLLNFEDMYTLLTQIEAVVNSRPISPLSNDPHDLYPLTPNDFLIGSPSNTTPEPDFTTGRLAKGWQQIQRMRQHFWKRWSTEYLTGLQKRTKWKLRNGNLAVGTLVAVKDEGLPPQSWKMARVTEVHPGQDGNVRVATLYLGNGNTMKRPVVKLCPILPPEEEEVEEEEEAETAE